MKKILSLIMMSVMALTMFAGCSSSDTTTTTEEETQVFRVGMECGYAPYNWTQNDDSNGAVPIADSQDYAYGYDVMMAKYIAEDMGAELEIYKIDWDSLPVAVQSGKIDAVIAGQSITADRLETVDFSTPYYYASVVALTRVDSEYASATTVSELAGATVTSQINTIWYDVAMPQIPDGDFLAAQESVPGMTVALQSGKCDVLVLDMPAAMAAVAADPTLTILTLDDEPFIVSDEDVNIGISVQKGNEELLEQINAALEGLTVEDFETMMDEAIAVQPLSE